MSFRRYALARIAATLAVLFLAVVATFVICHVFGPIELQGSVPDQVLAARAAHAHESFGHYLWRLIGHATLPKSLYGPRADVDIPAASIVTLSVVAWTLFIGLLIAVPLGLLWDRWPRWTRFFGWPFVYLAASLLTIWLALELNVHLSHDWEIFPVGNYADFFNAPAGPPGGPIQWAYHLILPAFILALPFAAIYTRVVRAVAGRVRHAHAEAPPEERAAAVALARRAGVITVAKGLLRDVGYLMGVALFVEMGFDLPGLGRTAVFGATFSGDTPAAGEHPHLRHLRRRCDPPRGQPPRRGAQPAVEDGVLSRPAVPGRAILPPV